MILRNGVIRTMDPSLPTVAALAVAGNTVVGGVGTHEEALPTPDTVDLAGRCVVPGLTDAHVHFPTWALTLQQVRLEGCRSIGEAVTRVRDAATSSAPGQLLVGYGWRSAEWSDGREPTRDDLDAVAGERRVALWSRDYHSLWLSSAALAAAGRSLADAGEVVELDAEGRPTGVLREAAAWWFRDRFLLASEDDLVSATRAAIRVAHARGVTAVHDKDGAIGALPVWQRIRAERGPMLRVWQSLPHERLGELAALGLRSGLGDEFLRLGYLKVFMDGTLGSGTAWLLDGSGICLTDTAGLAEVVRDAAQAGWPVAVHAIGDAANRAALDAFEATREEWGPRGLRPRIEHAQLLHPADIPRFAQIGVAASVQFSHAASDSELAEASWGDRCEGAYAYRSLLDSGAVVACGSDAPVEDLDPLLGIRAAVRHAAGRAGWRQEQALTVEQALVASTVTPAWLSGDELRRGRLLPGLLADLVVLDRDPVACPPDELAGISVVATMVGGRWVHNPPPWD